MKKARVCVFGSLFAVPAIVGLFVYVYLQNKVTQPENVWDKYSTEAERSAEFVGRYGPYGLTEKEISYFKSLSDSGDRYAAKILAGYYWKKGDRETARNFMKIARVPEDFFPQ